MKIKISNLTKGYNKFKALAGINCTLQAGEIIGLVGPNGAGKTTLLKAIANRLDYEGQIEYINVAKSKVDYIPEQPDLFPLLTVKEHFKFMALTSDLDNWQRKTDELLASFQLTEKKKAFGHELSKGMKQKTRLSLSLLREPKVILFDEPFSGLDPQSVQELRQLIRDLKSEGRIIIVSSHNLNTLYRLATRVLFLSQGELLRDQTREDILSEMERKDYVALEELFLEVIEGAAD